MKSFDVELGIETRTYAISFWHTASYKQKAKLSLPRVLTTNNTSLKSEKVIAYQMLFET